MEITYPEYACTKQRLDSFEIGIGIGSEGFAAKAKDGFFYDAEHLTAICFFCGDQEDLSAPFDRASHLAGNYRCQRIRQTWEARLNQPVTYKPKHPRCIDSVARYESFINWPVQIKQHPALLADAGFFYSGMTDKVICFYCDGRLWKWQKIDHPAYEHVKNFPDCPYARQVYARQCNV